MEVILYNVCRRMASIIDYEMAKSPNYRMLVKSEEDYDISNTFNMRFCIREGDLFSIKILNDGIKLHLYSNDIQEFTLSQAEFRTIEIL